MRSNTNINSEYEPLIGSNSSNYSDIYSKSNKSHGNLLKCIFFSIILITTVVIILYGISQENKNNPNWIQMEQENTNLGHIPTSWAEKEECNDDHPFILTLALKQQNTHLLDDHIDKVSNPENTETFHKYWSVDEIRSYFKPSTEALDTVIEWLSSNGFTTENGKLNMVTSYGNIIKVSLTCGDANNLLNAKYLFYEHDKTHKTRLRVKDGIYNIPSDIYQHIDFISPTIRFPLESHTKYSKTISEGKVEALTKKDNQNEYNIPQRLYQLYSMDSVLPDIVDKNMDNTVCRQSIASFLGQYYSDSDINLFWNTLGIYPQSKMERFPSTQKQGNGAEAELDTQYITSMGSGIYTDVYYINDEDDPFINLAEAIWNTDISPFVVSISYGADETELGIKYSTRCNEEFGKLALSGTTILVSSGDDGVKGNDKYCYNAADDDDIYDDDIPQRGKEWTISKDYTFVPTFPASAPYVTSVGGTEGGIIQNNIDSTTGETAWLYSGGGFSQYFNAPKWQKKAINRYFNSKNIEFPDKSRYVSTGRGYPDLASQSVDFVIAVNGEWSLVSGTSASSPTVAGMISMINYARIKNGKSSLGFINPMLYSLYKDKDYNYYFNDIIEGYNIGCQCDDNIGFYTANGWDPVTGFGTLKFSRLYQALLNID